VVQDSSALGETPGCNREAINLGRGHALACPFSGIFRASVVKPDVFPSPPSKREIDMNKAALWVRVSDPTQHPDNQLPDLRSLALRRGLEVVKVYEMQESAWRGAHRKLLTEVHNDARLGKFDFLILWSLDRLSREGPLATLEIVHRLGKLGVTIISVQEPWVEVSGEMRDLLLALVGWVARWESQRRSERTKAGLARAVSQGKQLGRPKGSRDSKKRRRSGYFARYAK
jgi:putative DNA-invertase from lambdoid prophage Rac